MLEKIPRPQKPEDIRRMMNVYACRMNDADDAWHVLATTYTGMIWNGVQIVKNQFDMRRYFDLLHEHRFNVVVETGLQAGGSAIFFMDCLEMLNMPNVPYVGIDLDCANVHKEVFGYPHPHVIIKRDCLNNETVQTVQDVINEKKSLIILDSVHTKEHVDEELRLYAPLCVSGSYLVIEDTDHSGYPVLADYGPSARQAVDAFMEKTGPEMGFVYDREIENRYGKFTNSPNAWLRRE